MKTDYKWIYLFYLDKRLVACFTSATRCVTLWKQLEISRCVGSPSVFRVKPNWILDKADVRFEDITKTIKKAL